MEQRLKNRKATYRHIILYNFEFEIEYLKIIH